MVLDKISTFASFVPQFTSINVVFCQKNKDNNNGNIRIMKLMIMMNGVKSSKCRRLKTFLFNLGHSFCKFCKQKSRLINDIVKFRMAFLFSTIFLKLKLNRDNFVLVD